MHFFMKDYTEMVTIGAQVPASTETATYWFEASFVS